MTEHDLFSPPTTEEVAQMIAESSREFFRQPFSLAQKTQAAKHFINELIALNAAINYLAQNPTQNTPQEF